LSSSPSSSSDSGPPQDWGGAESEAPPPGAGPAVGGAGRKALSHPPQRPGGSWRRAAPRRAAPGAGNLVLGPSAAALLGSGGDSESGSFCLSIPHCRCSVAFSAPDPFLLLMLFDILLPTPPHIVFPFIQVSVTPVLPSCIFSHSPQRVQPPQA
jgi:hypothetical protein